MLGNRTGKTSGSNVSIESGLEGRNNALGATCSLGCMMMVSIESGLEGRNNTPRFINLIKKTNLSQ